MTVSELINKLQQYDKNTSVMLNGYEGGYTDIKDDAFYMLNISLNIHGDDAGVYGEHERSDCEYHCKGVKEVVQALVISRNYEMEDEYKADISKGENVSES